jgi:hypothetical protein
MKRRALLLAAVLLTSCAPPPERSVPPGGETEVPSGSGVAERVLAREVGRIQAEAARIDSIFQPLPLLRPAQEEALRRFDNARQLERARALGVGRLLPAAELERLRATGSLVRLGDTEHWVVRDMEHSQPLAVPAVQALLTTIGERFHARLRELGAPPFRLEVSSGLRTAADQAALRRVNPNAALGESTHEYGTTVDVLYSAFAAPSTPIVEIDSSGADWLEPHLLSYANLAAERVAARRALELKAILGEVLLELQNQGAVMVTLERLQPVYHMTIAR